MRLKGKIIAIGNTPEHIGEIDLDIKELSAQLPEGLRLSVRKKELPEKFTFPAGIEHWDILVTINALIDYLKARED